MSEDIIRALGYLTLGSRLKRLGELLQADVERLVASEGARVPRGLFPILGALDRVGPQGISGIARSLGLAQPGVSRSVVQLEKLGLVVVKANGQDHRSKTVALSAKAVRLIAANKNDLWPRIENADAEICAPLSGPLLEQLADIEDALALRNLSARAAKRR